MSKMINPHGEFFDRSAQTMPVKIVASAIIPTRRVPVQDVCEYGQTDNLQAEKAE
jgi:hypothetical protein